MDYASWICPHRDSYFGLARFVRPCWRFYKKLLSLWVLVAIAWGFGSAIIITVLPLTESSEDIYTVLSGIFNYLTGREAHQEKDPNVGAKAEEEEYEAKDISYEDVAEVAA